MYTVYYQLVYVVVVTIVRYLIVSALSSSLVTKRQTSTTTIQKRPPGAGSRADTPHMYARVSASALWKLEPRVPSTKCNTVANRLSVMQPLPKLPFAQINIHFRFLHSVPPTDIYTVCDNGSQQSEYQSNRKSRRVKRVQGSDLFRQDAQLIDIFREDAHLEHQAEEQDHHERKVAE